jgi:hypothetical protein
MPTIDPMRIVKRLHKARRNKDTGETYEGYVLGVVPDGLPLPPAERAYLEAERERYVQQQIDRLGSSALVALDAVKRWEQPIGMQPSPKDAALMRYRVQLRWYVAADRDGQRLLRDEPFLFPASAVSEGLVRTLLFPDGIPDMFPGVSAEKDAKLAVTSSQDPSVVAGWWWTWNHTNYPHVQLQKMMVVDPDGSKRMLPRTEPIPEDV